MIPMDDPRITAFALDELDGADRRAVEAAMAADPAIAAEVEAIRATAREARTLLGTAGPVGLSTSQRESILAEAGRPAGSRDPIRRWAPFGVAFATAATLLLAIGLVGVRGGAGGSERAIETTTAARSEVTREAGQLTMEDGISASDGYRVSFPPTSGPAGAPTPVTSGSGRGAIGTFYANQAGAVSRLSASGGGGGHARDGRVRITLSENLTGAGQNPDNSHFNGSFQTGTITMADASCVEEGYARFVEQAFLRSADAPLSTFSIDVDTASYANIRRMLVDGQRPPADAVRVEELLNYFPYQYAGPTGTEPFAVHLEATACPWNLKHRLVRVGIKGREIERKSRPPMNLVFLVDVSGSMDSPNKLPLVKASMRMLLEELNERDSVAIVVYAGASGLALGPTWCEQKAAIQKAIDDLSPGGSTNGAAGIELAYQIATQRFLKDGVNRVVLATDGDFNVGVTSHEALLSLITEKAKSGVFLTCLGYGMGNLKDSTLELLADKGNGNYGYIDSTKEARKVLVEQASGTLVTIAKDVKIQVEFNPLTVASYRLVGYDNRLLAAKDFADDTKDAGEIGAGHTVTALYEVVPVSAEEAAARKPDEEPLRYAPPTPPRPVSISGVVMDPIAHELMTVKLRWKEPTGSTSVKQEFPLTDAGLDYAKASADTKFACSVAAFAMLLKGSAYAGNATLDAVSEWAGEGLSFDPSGYRKEFVDLVARAKSLLTPPAPK